MTLPAEGALGNYSVRAMLESDRPKPKTPEDAQPGDEPSPEARRLRARTRRRSTARSWSPRIAGPTSASTSTLTGDAPIAGEPLKGVVTARYLFGAPMGARPVTWTFTRSPVYRRAGGRHRASSASDRWEFVGWPDRRRRDPARRGAAATRRRSTTTGELPLTLDTAGATPACPTSTRSKATSRTCRGSTSPTAPASLVHPAPWYIGLRRPSYFVEQKAGLDDRGRRRRARRRGRAGRAGRRHADADSVDERAPRRRQRLLHLGHRAQGNAGRHVDGDDGAPSPCRSTIAVAERRLLRPRGDGARRRQARSR